jgi:hypothetical protein
MRRLMMCIPYMSNYYLYNFLKIIDNKKIEKNDEIDDDVDILYITRYAIKTCSELEM